jgi:hypothetical protein
VSYSIDWYGDLPDDDETMVDLGGGMVVPLRELVESAEEWERDKAAVARTEASS